MLRKTAAKRTWLRTVHKQSLLVSEETSNQCILWDPNFSWRSRVDVHKLKALSSRQGVNPCREFITIAGVSKTPERAIKLRYWNLEVLHSLWCFVCQNGGVPIVCLSICIPWCCYSLCDTQRWWYLSNCTKIIKIQ